MLSPSSPSQAGIGSGVPACSGATGTTYLTPTSKTLQSHASDGLQTSATGSGASIPYSHYGGSKSVAPTIMTSSLMHRKKPLLTRSEVSHPARQDEESVEEPRLETEMGNNSSLLLLCLDIYSFILSHQSLPIRGIYLAYNL